MASTEDAVDQVLAETKLAPTEKRKLGDRILTTIREIRQPGIARLAATRAEMAQYQPVPLTGLAVVGGAVAEPIRRSVVGRVVTPVIQQGLGLIALGYGAQWIGRAWRVPLAGPIGAAHAAYGGALISVGLYGSKKNPDPVKVALEGTTYKALHPKSDDADENSGE